MGQKEEVTIPTMTTVVTMEATDLRNIQNTATSTIAIEITVVRNTETTVEETGTAREIVRGIGEIVAETTAIAAIETAKIVTDGNVIETQWRGTGTGIETGTETETEIEIVLDATGIGTEIEIGGGSRIGIEIAIATTIIVEKVWTLSTTMVALIALLWKGSTTNRNLLTTP